MSPRSSPLSAVGLPVRRLGSDVVHLTNTDVAGRPVRVLGARAIRVLGPVRAWCRATLGGDVILMERGTLPTCRPCLRSLREVGGG